MRLMTRPPSLRRQALSVGTILLAILAIGYGLSRPVWQCATLPASGTSVVSRDCHYVPGSRAAWTWLTGSQPAPPLPAPRP